MKLIDLMMDKGLIKREGSRLFSQCDWNEEITLELNEIEKELDKVVEGMICSDCGEFNCNCDWFVLNRKNQKLKNRIKELEE